MHHTSLSICMIAFKKPPVADYEKERENIKFTLSDELMNIQNGNPESRT